MIRVALVLTLALAAWPPSLSRAMPSAPVSQEPVQPTFRTRTEGVRVDVLVSDGDKPVTGLKSADFELRDEGVRQDVQAVSLAENPLDVILVLDTSISLGANGLAHLIRAADTLFSRLHARDRAALVTFSQDVNIRAALTPQHARVRAMLRGLQIRGTTSAIDAAYAGFMLQTEPDRPTLMLVFSDGVDTASWLRADAVLQTARRSGVVPYAVVVGVGAASRVRTPQSGSPGASATEPDQFLDRLVETGGGVFLDAEQTTQLERRFGEALDSFRQRYVLTYTPTGVERRGWHTLAIEVKGHRYRIRARPGYDAGAPTPKPRR